MYVGTSGGLGAYRRVGLGLNCPGDAGCPGNVQPDSYQYTGSAALYCDSTSALYNPATCNNLYAAPAASSFTAWLNANQTMVMYGAAGVLGLLLLTGRR